jgi:hypothetical protein
MNADTEPATDDQPRHNDSSEDPEDDHSNGFGLAGPMATLQITVGVLGALSVLLAVIAGRAAVVVTAFGVIALAPLALGALIRAIGWRGRRSVERYERNEDAALVLPVAALCWQPIVILSDLREQIVDAGTTTFAAGIAAIALAAYCTRR